MLKKILGFAPKLESDGSYSPSKMALKMGVSDKTDFENITYQKYQGKRSKILVIFTEEKNLKMKNGRFFSRKSPSRSFVTNASFEKCRI